MDFDDDGPMTTMDRIIEWILMHVFSSSSMKHGLRDKLGDKVIMPILATEFTREEEEMYSQLRWGKWFLIWLGVSVILAAAGRFTDITHNWWQTMLTFIIWLFSLCFTGLLASYDRSMSKAKRSQLKNGSPRQP